MTKLDWALLQARDGYDVFPCWWTVAEGVCACPDGAECPGPGKHPRISGWQSLATQNEPQIRVWWATWPEANIGLACGDNRVTVDVDVKNNGQHSVLRMETQGKELPPTRIRRTASGGYHLDYLCPLPCRNTVSKIAPGVDTRGRGGYVLGAGSSINGRGNYSCDMERPCAPAPDWLIQATAVGAQPEAGQQKSRLLAPEVSTSAAGTRARTYLASLPEVPAGEGQRNGACFAAAARVRDFGATLGECIALMHGHWRVASPYAELEATVRHVYSYAQKPPGSAAPEVQFEAQSAPPPARSALLEEEPGDLVDQVNRYYSFCMLGGQARAIREFRNDENRPCLDFVNLDALEKRLANCPGAFKAWMLSGKRRTYEGVTFAPGKNGDYAPAFFNLWRGWSIPPLPAGAVPGARAQAALDAFLLHVRVNMCDSDEKLFRQRVGFWAHMLQRPHEKPRYAQVFKGGKGSGKSAVLELLAHVLWPYSGSTSESHHITGHFNAHLENAIMFTLEEAFWAGAKGADSTLKTRIDKRTIRIERKGQDSFEIRNYTRFFILGNEDWIIPASADERRYDVSEVVLRTHTPGSKAALDFFEEMRLGMEAGGGYALLLRFLLDFDLTGLDFRHAPHTPGLAAQKLESLGVFEQWWYECLRSGGIAKSEFALKWPEGDVAKKIMRDALAREYVERNIGGWRPNEFQFGRLMRKVCPSAQRDQKDKTGANSYRLPSLAGARADWDKYIGSAEKWES